MQKGTAIFLIIGKITFEKMKKIENGNIKKKKSQKLVNKKFVITPTAGMTVQHCKTLL